MRLPQAAMMAVIAASAASAFQTHVSSRHAVKVDHSATTALKAFQLKEGETKNMFEGPRPLVKERDACGVGFIANTQSGGELSFVCVFFTWPLLEGEKFGAHHHIISVCQQ